jgi:ribosome assembly protein 4
MQRQTNPGIFHPNFLQGHTNWVLYVSWSPDGKKVATGGMDSVIRIWCPFTGKQIGNPLKGHKKYVTALSWEPIHKFEIDSPLAKVEEMRIAQGWQVRRKTEQ